MTWYQDLAPCDYFGEAAASFLRAIGWLSIEYPYATGRVEKDVFERLQTLLKDPWQPTISCGIHSCDLCVYQAVCHGSNNIFVPGDGFLYVCPELILHYMNAHAYRPPDEFCAAVIGCPPRKSSEYRKAILKCGAGFLLKPHGQ